MSSTHSGAAAGVGLGPRNRISEAARQEVLDAAAVLQVRRSEVAARAARGDLNGVELVGRGPASVNRWMTEASKGWRELVSMRPSATVAQLRTSLPQNRARLETGLRMTSIFGTEGLDPDARVLLANERVGTYLFSVAPVQMKIVDGHSVLLEGPALEGEPTLMIVGPGPCLEAAWRYWQTALKCAYPARDAVGTLRELTPRQRQVVALMATGISDEAIATSIGVSVRTVRADIAGVLDALGVRTRFAAGLRLQLWSEQHG